MPRRKVQQGWSNRSAEKAFCPCCGRITRPVYCAASTDDNPIMLAHSITVAARMLNLSPTGLTYHLAPWRDGFIIMRGKQHQEKSERARLPGRRKGARKKAA